MPTRVNRSVNFGSGLAGNLNKRFAFSKRIEVNDGYGNLRGDWQEQFIIWVGKRYLVGGEGVFAQRLSGHQPIIVTLRISTLTRQIETHWMCRDVISSETFNIRSITPATDREGFIDLLIESGVAEG